MATEKSSPPRTSNVIIGGFWGMIGVGGQTVLQLSVLMVLARQLTPTEFGLANTAVIVALFGKMLFELGVGQALIQKREVSERDLRTAFALTLTCGAAGVGILLFLSKHIAILFSMPKLSDILPFYCFIFIFRSISIVSEARLIRSLQFRLMVGLEILSYAIGYAGIGIFMALQGWGVWSLVGAHVGQEAVKALGLWLFSPSLYWPILDFSTARQLLKFGIAQSYAQVASYTANQGDSLVVAKLLGEYSLGIYGRTYQLVVMPINLAGRAIDKVLFPVLSKIQTDRRRVARSFRRGLVIVTTVAFPSSIFLVALAPEIVSLVLGNTWRDVVSPFQIMAGGIFLRMSYKVCDALIKSTGEVFRRAINQSMYAAIVVTAAVVSAQWGISAVAFGTQIALFVNLLLMYGLACSLMRLSPVQMLHTFLPGLLIGGLTGTVTLLAAMAFRQWKLGGPSTLILVAFLNILIISLIIRYARDRVFGEDAAWLIDGLANSLPPALRRGFIRLFVCRST